MILPALNVPDVSVNFDPFYTIFPLLATGFDPIGISANEIGK
jgi:hypothetical protein